MMMTIDTQRAYVFVILAFLSGMANAETDQGNTNISVSSNVALVSDYIWRGQSQTWGKPALQVGTEASHTSGAYAGFWASTVSSQWVPGAQFETDWYVGFRNKFPATLSEFGYDLNLIYVYLPGGNFNKTGFNLPSSSPNTVEVYAAVNYKSLSLKTGRVLTKFYGWDTTNSAPGGFVGDPTAGVTGSTNGSYFVELNASQDIAEGWNVNGQLGHQTINHSVGLSWSYYKLGIVKSIDSWTMGLACTGGNEPAAFKDFLGLRNNGSTYSAARPAVVLSLGHGW
ncbi:MAG: TorF family putative porin [Sideroxydans sp.]|jgi:uncharacterized protein (TIGR02001 family)